MSKEFSLKANNVKTCAEGLNSVWANLEEIGKGVKRTIDSMLGRLWSGESGDQFAVEAEEFHSSLAGFLECGRAFSGVLMATGGGKGSFSVSAELEGLERRADAFAGIFADNYSQSNAKPPVYLSRSSKAALNTKISKADSYLGSLVWHLSEVSKIRLSDFSIETEAEECKEIAKLNQRKLDTFKSAIDRYENDIDILEGSIKAAMGSLCGKEGLAKPWGGNLDEVPETPELGGDLSVGSSGYDVLMLQKRLNELGYRDGNGRKLDENGEFDKATQYAVSRYLASAGLATAGEAAVTVTFAAWEHMLNTGTLPPAMPSSASQVGEPCPPAALGPQSRPAGMAAIDFMVEWAISQRGVTEGSFNNNVIYSKDLGISVTRENISNSSWCVIFINWCAERAEIPSDIIPRGIYGTENLKKEYQKLGRLGDSSTYSPKAGDLLFKPGHTALVVADVPNPDGISGIVYTIDGNTNDGIDSNYVDTFEKVDYTRWKYSIDPETGVRKYSKVVDGFGINYGTSSGNRPEL